MPTTNKRRSALTFCEEESEYPGTADSPVDPLEEEPLREPSIKNGGVKRMSLFHRLFGRKVPKGMAPRALPVSCLVDAKQLLLQMYHAQNPPPTAAKN